MAESYHYGSYFGWANCYWNYIPYNLIFQLSINLVYNENLDSIIEVDIMLITKTAFCR